MHRVYELLIQAKDGDRRLRLLAAESAEQVMQQARELLDLEDLECVEVTVDGAHLFSVSR